MAAKKFAIGQVIFVFSPTKYSLLPVQVVEESIIRTVSGETTAYKVTFGAPESSVITYPLEKVIGQDGQVFVTLDEAYTSLMASAKATIGKIVSEVTKSAVAWYGADRVVPPALLRFTGSSKTEAKTVLLAEPDDQHKKDASESSTGTVIVLPDGTSARLKVSGSDI